MKKMQLKNVASMNDYTPGSQAMALSYVDDSGLWNDSGFWDESGIWDESGVVYDVMGGYHIINEAIYGNDGRLLASIRFIALWSQGNISQPPSIRTYCGVDDETQNPYLSGSLGEPIIIHRPEFIKIERIDTHSTPISGHNNAQSFSAIYTIKYLYDEIGHGNFESSFIQEKYLSNAVTVVIPAECFNRTFNE